MSSLSREKGYYKERALRCLGELIPRETEAPKEIEEYPVGQSQEKPDEEPSPKSALHDAAPAAQIVLPPGLEPPGAFGGGTLGTLGGGTLDRDPDSNDEHKEEDGAAAMDVDDARAVELATVRGTWLEAAEIAKLEAEGGGTWLGGGPQAWTSPQERRDWPITPNDMVSEQLMALFSGREMKDGDHIVFAPGTYKLWTTAILYDHEGSTQILRNIALRGTGGDPTKVIICADEDDGLDHLFYVCREPGGPYPTPITYSGPEHPVVHFSGLTFRNDHLTRGRNAIVCAIGDVDVVMDDCRVLRPHDAPTGRRQNMLGKFRQPLFLGIAAGRVNQYRRALYGYDY